jgi:uncharacterized phage-associated protein
MPTRFREEKAAQAAAHLLLRHGRRLNLMKLVKLLYLTDRTALVRWGRPVTFDSFFSLPHGPVLSSTLNLINDEPNPAQPRYWHRLISERRGYDVDLIGDAPTDQLSPAEIILLDEIDDLYGSMDQWELRRVSHDLPEWRDPGTSAIPIQIADILIAEGYSPEEAAQVEIELEHGARVLHELS